MKMLKLKKGNLSQIVKLAIGVLERDGLMVVPADTVYGLAANAQSSAAANKIYNFKGRRFGKGISVFLPKVEEIRKYAFLNKDHETIIRTLLPGPFTVVLKSKHQVAPEIESSDETIGVRVIDNELVQALTKTAGFPITATSANLAGKGPHYSVGSFLSTLSAKKRAMLDLIVDAGQLPRRPTSTVVRLVRDEIKILRQGALNLKLIKHFGSKSEKETQKTAQEIYKLNLIKHLRNQAAIVVLKGDLGVGKTVFAKGIGELFGYQFTSPTFVMMDEYIINRLPLKNIYHLDLYRIESEEEIKELKLESFLKPGNLMLIEWGEKLSVFQDLKKKKVAFFLLQIEDEGNSKRKISLYQL